MSSSSPRPSLLRHLEALLFSAGEPLPPDDLIRCLHESVAPNLTEADLDDALEALRVHYTGPDAVFQVQFTGGGYRLLTKAEYHPTLSISRAPQVQLNAGAGR